MVEQLQYTKIANSDERIKRQIYQRQITSTDDMLTILWKLIRRGASAQNRIFVSLRMQQLNFPAYTFRFRNSADKVAVFDEIRKKFVILTPEEWVRQHVVSFLHHEKKYPKSLINVEKLLKINGIVKRYDVVVFNNDGSILVLVECKAPEIKISQATFDQIARYNLTMKAEFLMVTNGNNHYFCRMDYENEKYDFLPQLPEYDIDRMVVKNPIIVNPQ